MKELIEKLHLEAKKAYETADQCSSKRDKAFFNGKAEAFTRASNMVNDFRNTKLMTRNEFDALKPAGIVHNYEVDTLTSADTLEDYGRVSSMLDEADKHNH